MSCLLNCIRDPSSEVAYSVVSQDVQEARVSSIGQRVLETLADHYFITGAFFGLTLLAATTATAAMLPMALPAVAGGAFTLMYFIGDRLATIRADRKMSEQNHKFKAKNQELKRENVRQKIKLEQMEVKQEIQNEDELSSILGASATDLKEQVSDKETIKYFKVRDQLNTWCSRAKGFQNLETRKAVKKIILEAFRNNSPTLDLRSLHGEIVVPIDVLRDYFPKGITVEQNEGDQVGLVWSIPIKIPANCPISKLHSLAEIPPEVLEKYFPKETIIRQEGDRVVVRKKGSIKAETKKELNDWCDQAKNSVDLENRKITKKQILSAIRNVFSELELLSCDAIDLPVDVINKLFPKLRKLTVSQNDCNDDSIRKRFEDLFKKLNPYCNIYIYAKKEGQLTGDQYRASIRPPSEYYYTGTGYLRWSLMP